MDNKERRYWNVIKGFAVFLMLWGHCIQFCSMGYVSYFENAVFRAIYSFHMPVFMIVSGYLFFGSCQRRELKELLIYKIQGLLQPIVFFTIFHNVMMLIPNYILSDRIDVFFGALFEGIEYSFWFLWAVLISSLAVGVSCKITKNGVLQIVLMIMGTFFVALFPQWEMSLFMYPFFAVGFLCARYKDVLLKWVHKLKYLALLIFPLMLPFYETKHFIYITPVYSQALGLAESLKIDVFRWAIGLAGCAFLMVLVEILLKIESGHSRLKKLLDVISVLGMNSLQMYCLSDTFLSGYLPHIYRKLMEPFGTNIFAVNMTLYNFVVTPLVAAAYAAGIYGVICLLRKIKLHGVLFGR